MLISRASDVKAVLLHESGIVEVRERHGIVFDELKDAHLGVECELMED